MTLIARFTIGSTLRTAPNTAATLQNTSGPW